MEWDTAPSGVISGKIGRVYPWDNGDGSGVLLTGHSPEDGKFDIPRLAGTSTEVDLAFASVDSEGSVNHKTRFFAQVHSRRAGGVFGGAPRTYGTLRRHDCIPATTASATLFERPHHLVCVEKFTGPYLTLSSRLSFTMVPVLLVFLSALERVAEPPHSPQRTLRKYRKQTNESLSLLTQSALMPWGSCR